MGSQLRARLHHSRKRQGHGIVGDKCFWTPGAGPAWPLADVASAPGSAPGLSSGPDW